MPYNCGMFGYKLVKSAIEKKSGTFNLTDSSSKFFTIIDGKEVTLELNSPFSYVQAYQSCPPLAAVINRIGKAFTAANYEVVDKEGNEAKGPNALKYKKLIDKPNPMQSWGQFIEQVQTYKRIFGNAFIYANTPVGFDNSRALSLWALPNVGITYEHTGKMIDQVTRSEIVSRVWFEFSGQRTEIDLANLLIMQDNNVNFLAPYFGDSRLRALKYPIHNITSALRARNVLIENRGALGAWVNRGKDAVGHVAIGAKEKESLLSQFHSRYGLKEGKSPIILTDSDLDWVQSAMNVQELGLFEEVSTDIRHIADTFEYPFELLGNDKGVTFANKAEARKDLYQSVIIPEAKDFCQAMTTFLGMDKTGLVLEANFEHLEILQRSENDRQAADNLLNQSLQIQYQNGIITLNEWRMTTGLEPIAAGDTYYMAPDKVTKVTLIPPSNGQPAA
jgi:HK97 family phage portal protein